MIKLKLYIHMRMIIKSHVLKCGPEEVYFDQMAKIAILILFYSHRRPYYFALAPLYGVCRKYT